VSIVRIVATIAALVATVEIAMAEGAGFWRMAQRVAPNAKPAVQPAPKPAPMPHRTEIINYDNWTVTCREFTEGPRKRVCSATLQVRRTENNQVVLEWTFTLNDQNRPITVIKTPTGIMIEPGVELQLGKGRARKMPYTSCFPNYCTAVMTVDGRFVRDVGAAPAADIVIRAANGAGLKFNISLKGFDKSYAALRQ